MFVACSILLPFAALCGWVVRPGRCRRNMKMKENKVEDMTMDLKDREMTAAQLQAHQTALGQYQIITKGTQQVVQADELLAKLENSILSGNPLIVKLGLDPSAPDIHLGHAVVLRKIRQLQDLGHQAVIVIGDFTGRIGDPSGRSKTRPVLTPDQVLTNAKTYEQQIFTILDRSKTRLCFNHDWLAKLDFEDVLRLAGQVTVARMLERDSFADRFSRKEPISLHEFFYPLMQAYDSVHLQADIELGGTDQTFNILMGRSLQKNYDQASQVALFMPLLEGLDGIEKMSKSLGNYVGIAEDADTMFRKIMIIPDALIIRYAELATDWHPREIAALIRQLDDSQVNPRDIKLRLAREITRLYHGEGQSAEAEIYFRTVFQMKRPPEQMPEYECPAAFVMKDGSIDLPALLLATGLAASKSDARRLIAQRGVRVDGTVVDKLTWTGLAGCQVLQVGKDKFCKIKIGCMSP